MTGGAEIAYSNRLPGPKTCSHPARDTNTQQ